MSLVSNLSSLATRVATEFKSVYNKMGDLTTLQTTDKTTLVAAVNEVKGSVSGAAGINDATTSSSSTWSSSKVSTELATKAPTSHTHTTSQVTGLDTALSGKAAASHSHAIGDLPVATSGTSNTTQLVRADDSRLSNARTPTAHVHAIADTTGLQTALDGKSATGHTHVAANVTDFGSAVDARINTVLDRAAAGTTLDTLDEIATALGDDPNFATTMTTALGKRVKVDGSQTFTSPEQAQGRSNIGAASDAALTTLSTNVGDTTTNFVTTFEAGLV